MSYWVYMLECGDGTIYTGQSRQIDYRVAQHAAGEGATYTARRLEVKLIWSQEVPTLEEAQALEFKIKKWSHAKKVALAHGDWAEFKRIHRAANSAYNAAKKAKKSGSGF